jgi:type 1 glutamine amidotransferase
MRRLLLVLAGAGMIAACGGVAASSIRTGSERASRVPEVLVLTQTRGYHHASIPWAVDAMKRLAAHDGRYRLTFLPTAAVLGPALKHASAVVFLLTSGELPLSSSGKQALLAFVHQGGGLVGIHSAADTFHSWPAYTQLIGAEFSHHPPPSTQTVVVEDRSSPATQTLGGAFTIHEEFYVFKHDPRRTAHVLARLGTGSGGADLPLVWCRRAGRGRVLYDALGHFPQTWQDPRQLALVRGGLEWVLRVAPAGRC